MELEPEAPALAFTDFVGDVVTDFWRIRSYSACLRDVLGVSGAVIAPAPLWCTGVDGTDELGVRRELRGVRGENMDIAASDLREGVCGNDSVLLDGEVVILEAGVIGKGIANGFIGV